MTNFIRSAAEFINAPTPVMGWGPWKLDSASFTLWLPFPDSPHGDIPMYEVDLEDCLTPSRVLDWICQITWKEWADADTVAGFVRALNDVLDPQANLCPHGSNQRLSRRKVRDLVQRRKPWARS